MPRPEPTGRELFFRPSELIVSKTDTRGRITYANSVFQHLAGYAEHELLGRPHSIIRHPDMPMCVFQLLWERIAAGHEVFAYVVNLARNGDHYWVFAHVTPTYDADHQIVGYHSNRRVPARDAVEQISGIYQLLRDEERRHKDKREGLAASRAVLDSHLESQGMTYDAFVWDLTRRCAAA